MSNKSGKRGLFSTFFEYNKIIYLFYFYNNKLLY